MKCSKCNAEISNDAKICTECGCEVNSQLTEKEISINDINIHFVTHEPNFFQKILQVYWLIPKSTILKEFKVKDGIIYISVVKGQKFTAQLNQCTFKYEEDNSGRTLIKIFCDKQKIKFLEVPFMLKDEEWEQIITFCKYYNNAKETLSGKIANVLRWFH